MKIKALFDKEKACHNLKIGWGISYLIDETVLFDTAEKGEYLVHNMNELGIDVSKIENVVISHNHWDHTGGIESLLKIKNDIKIYVCSDLFKEYKDKMPQANCIEVTASNKIHEGIYTTGCIATTYKEETIYEQSLICKTDKGISVICGCSHPGVLEILHKVKELFPKEKIYAFLGGFHLINKEKRLIRYIADEMKKEDIQKVGPSHCSGFEALGVFEEVYGADIITIQAGTEIEI